MTIINTKRVPRLRFRGFSDEWEEKKLGEIVKYTKGFAFKSSSYKQSGVRIVRASDLGPTYIRRDNKKIFIDSDDANGFKRYELKKGNIIITTVGSRPEMIESAVGRGIYVDNDKEGLLNQNMLKIEPEDGVNTQFIFSYINTVRYIEHIKAIKRGNANQANITVKDLLDYKISYTTAAEQEKIAGFLGVVDDKISGLQRKKELLEKYKKGTMQGVFSQKIRFKDENGKDYPDWEEKHGNEVFQSVSDKNNGQRLPILAITQDKGAVPRDQINYDISVTDASINSYKVVKKGDFIISLRSFQGGIEHSDFNGICSPAYIVLRSIVSIDEHFYIYFLKTRNYIQRLTQKLEGIRDGKMISFKYFSDTRLPYPSPVEQEKIADFLSSIDDKINLMKKELEQAKTFKKALLQQMFV